MAADRSQAVLGKLAFGNRFVSDNRTNAMDIRVAQHSTDEPLHRLHISPGIFQHLLDAFTAYYRPYTGCHFDRISRILAARVTADI